MILLLYTVNRLLNGRGQPYVS